VDDVSDDETVWERSFSFTELEGMDQDLKSLSATIHDKFLDAIDLDMEANRSYIKFLEE
jgi:hypothetical protein